MFVDEVKIYVKAGDGGRGCVSFRREKGVPRGGPNGGDGGKGGDVILEGDSGLLTLLDFRYHPHLKAQRGQHGRGKGCNGRSGEDLTAKVPLGTIVKDFGEILVHGQRLVVAHGGRGGRGNKQFATSTDRAPRRAEPGFSGEEKRIQLELRLIADIGIVGAPNAGKSTLINCISTTHSKVASYPFTTLNPVLGVVDLGEEHKPLTLPLSRPRYYRGAPERGMGEGHRVVVADMPGLIEGASQGKGLGDRFLRHIERTRALVIILDMSGNPINDYQMLREELLLYNPALAEKPHIIAANKMDIDVSKDNLESLKKLVDNIEIFPISALKKEGIGSLLNGMRRISV